VTGAGPDGAVNALGPVAGAATVGVAATAGAAGGGATTGVGGAGALGGVGAAIGVANPPCAVVGAAEEEVELEDAAVVGAGPPTGVGAKFASAVGSRKSPPGPNALAGSRNCTTSTVYRRVG